MRQVGQGQGAGRRPLARHLPQQFGIRQLRRERRQARGGSSEQLTASSVALRKGPGAAVRRARRAAQEELADADPVAFFTTFRGRKPKVMAGLSDSEVNQHFLSLLRLLRLPPFPAQRPRQPPAAPCPASQKTSATSAAASLCGWMGVALGCRLSPKHSQGDGIAIGSCLDGRHTRQVWEGGRSAPPDQRQRLLQAGRRGSRVQRRLPSRRQQRAGRHQRPQTGQWSRHALACCVAQTRRGRVTRPCQSSISTPAANRRCKMRRKPCPAAHCRGVWLRSSGVSTAAPAASSTPPTPAALFLAATGAGLCWR